MSIGVDCLVADRDAASGVGQLVAGMPAVWAASRRSAGPTAWHAVEERVRSTCVMAVMEVQRAQLSPSALADLRAVDGQRRGVRRTGASPTRGSRCTAAAHDERLERRTRGR